MKKTIILIFWGLILLSGCFEKRETVIKKIERLPSEDISKETIPVVVMLPREKEVEITIQRELHSPETTVAIEKTILESEVKSEKFEPDTRIKEKECVSVEPKTDSLKSISKKRSTRDEKNEPVIKAYKSPLVLYSGECLIYRIKWNSVNVGKLMLACKKEKMSNRDVYHIMGITIPEGIWTKVGNGYNRFDSYIDAKNNLPFYYYNYSASPSTYQITKSIIDHKTKALTYEVRKYKGGKQYGYKTGKVNFDGIVFDGLSALYAMRGMAGDSMTPSSMPVGITRITEIYLYFLKGGTDNFAVGSRPYWLIQSETSEDEAIFKKGKLFISISADSERLPLLLKGKVPLGTATVELVSRKDLEENFSTDARSLTEILNSSF
ncbi:MAG: DUF3108 domain-containing protein [Candidatus Omnitrophica bacterium]|nr:DUF3108 domain-containing protein [Candidatus Omnitrophota bacterium]MCM8825547.1 DUF3108 domain-containing protein [Candidatus Omnitrophota bacterium]